MKNSFSTQNSSRSNLQILVFCQNFFFHLSILKFFNIYLEYLFKKCKFKNNSKRLLRRKIFLFACTAIKILLLFIQISRYKFSPPNENIVKSFRRNRNTFTNGSVCVYSLYGIMLVRNKKLILVGT